MPQLEVPRIYQANSHNIFSKDLVLNAQCLMFQSMLAQKYRLSWFRGTVSPDFHFPLWLLQPFCPSFEGFPELWGEGPNEDFQLRVCIMSDCESLHLFSSAARKSLSDDNQTRYWSMNMSEYCYELFDLLLHVVFGSKLDHWTIQCLVPGHSRSFGYEFPLKEWV